ncbi:MAG: dienelactone hydrolase family protein [Ignavibacteriae bacterium]|nr:dienelactone hydrolase family protein [Ignavibacteriota bacterium]MCB9242178.1 dienelactone hydrolase family protein [Ignavibacteriales bacterium]
MPLTKKSLKVKVSKEIGSVSALLYTPAKPTAILVFAHGAGAGIKNRFMETVSNTLGDLGIATLRFNFPYMEAGKKVPDRKPVATAAVAAAVEKAHELYPKLPVFAGGKSFGGRMTSTAASEDMLSNIKGIVFFGFPLHAPGRPSSDRAEHLFSVKVPMLFLQGTRDALASFDLIKPLCKKLGKKATLYTVDGADHSFHVPKDNKLTDSEVIKLICDEIKTWIAKTK